MTKQKFFFLLAMVTMLPLQRVCADPAPLNFQLSIIDHTNGGGRHRTPVLSPSVSIEEYTLYFDTPCDGCELRIVDEDGDIVYSTTIPSSCSSLDLPSTLSGDFELQIIQGNFCFYAGIQL